MDSFCWAVRTHLLIFSECHCVSCDGGAFSAEGLTWGSWRLHALGCPCAWSSAEHIRWSTTKMISSLSPCNQMQEEIPAVPPACSCIMLHHAGLSPSVV